MPSPRKEEPIARTSGGARCSPDGPIRCAIPISIVDSWRAKKIEEALCDRPVARTMRLLSIGSIGSLVTFLLLGACAAPSEDPEDTEVGRTVDALNERVHLGVSDVTILYPLPRRQEHFDSLLSPASERDRGELLSPAVFQQLLAVTAPPMMMADGSTPVAPPQIQFARYRDRMSELRVVGIRLDPCFGEASNFGDASCVNMVRLTTQFFTPGDNRPDGGASLHLLYTVSRADFLAIARGMVELRNKAGLPLQRGFYTLDKDRVHPTVETVDFGVHPTLAAEGLKGPYATALADLILKYVGEQTLSQIAFCIADRGPEVGRNNAYNQFALEDNRWVFGRFEVRGGQMYPIETPTLNSSGFQYIDTSPSATAARDVVVMNPPPRTPDNFLYNFNYSINRPNVSQPPLDNTRFAAGRASALNFLNPMRYTVRNSDCGSCHTADQAISPTRRASAVDGAYRSPTYRLDHTATGGSPFRMFGYRSNGSTILSARVINETAVVLENINKQMGKP